MVEALIADRTDEIARLRDAVAEHDRLTARLRGARAALAGRAPAPVPSMPAAAAVDAPSTSRLTTAALIALAGALLTLWMLQGVARRHRYRMHRPLSISPAVGSHGDREDSQRWLHGAPITAAGPRVSAGIDTLFGAPPPPRPAAATPPAAARRPGPAAASARRGRRRRVGLRRYR
jgi:hypothetical protein